MARSAVTRGSSSRPPIPHDKRVVPTFAGNTQQEGQKRQLHKQSMIQPLIIGDTSTILPPTKEWISSISAVVADYILGTLRPQEKSNVRVHASPRTCLGLFPYTSTIKVSDDEESKRLHQEAFKIEIIFVDPEQQFFTGRLGTTADSDYRSHEIRKRSSLEFESRNTRRWLPANFPRVKTCPPKQQSPSPAKHNRPAAKPGIGEGESLGQHSIRNASAGQAPVLLAISSPSSEQAPVLLAISSSPRRASAHASSDLFVPPSPLRASARASSDLFFPPPGKRLCF
ncbi:hypothetical protein CRG98_016834 [Punica granatum]|uniref:Uncharacterized protein n=1 Tax=Punica granatum TaxID=22663 RepID=A0A2I0K2J7_PUNGR|nr:hypothetical protein CRG98_016834 [Punica granatum]